MQRKNTKNVLESFSLKTHQSNKCYGRVREEEPGAEPGFRHKGRGIKKLSDIGASYRR
jgi:hypothetical protein